MTTVTQADRDLEQQIAALWPYVIGQPAHQGKLAAAYREAAEKAGAKAMQWQDIATAPKDGTEFLSCGGVNCVGRAQPTRWLSPGPYTTENGKNAEGRRRYQWPDGFYWAGYDGFVGPIEPNRWMAMPALDPAQIAGGGK